MSSSNGPYLTRVVIFHIENLRDETRGAGVTQLVAEMITTEQKIKTKTVPKYDYFFEKKKIVLNYETYVNVSCPYDKTQRPRK